MGADDIFKTAVAGAIGVLRKRDLPGLVDAFEDGGSAGLSRQQQRRKD